MLVFFILREFGKAKFSIRAEMFKMILSIFYIYLALWERKKQVDYQHIWLNNNDQLEPASRSKIISFRLIPQR